VGSSPTPGTTYPLEIFAFRMHLAGEMAMDEKIGELSDVAVPSQGPPEQSADRKVRDGSRPSARINSGKSIASDPLSRSTDNSV
jgi:hypothetical protein